MPFETPAETTSTILDIDPSPIIISIALTVSIFPAITVAVADPILHQRSTLRDVLTVYKGIILGGYIAFPLWYYLVESRLSSAVSTFTAIFTVIGFSWARISSRFYAPITLVVASSSTPPSMSPVVTGVPTNSYAVMPSSQPSMSLATTTVSITPTVDLPSAHPSSQSYATPTPMYDPTSMPSGNIFTTANEQTMSPTTGSPSLFHTPSALFAPSFEPSTDHSHIDTMAALNDPKASALPPTCQPSASPTSFTPTNIGKFPKLSLGGITGESSGYHSCLTPRTTPSPLCFVSTFPGWKAKHTTPNVHVPLAFVTNRVTLTKKITPMQQTLLHAANEPNPTVSREEDEQPLIPLLMYSVVPFVPSVVLATLNDDYLSLKSKFSAASTALPIASLATDSPEYLSLSDMYNDSMQSLFVLLLSKRLALYFLATCATFYAGWRASMGVTAIRNGQFTGPGDALDKLNDEILEGRDISAAALRSDGPEEEKEDENSDDEDEDLFATLLDNNPQSSNVGSALAVALPLVLSATLAFSYLITVSSDIQLPSTDESAFGDIQGMLPFLFSLPSAVLCLLFMTTEFRWAIPKKKGDELATGTSLFCAGNIIALAYVVGAYLAKIHPTLSLPQDLQFDVWPLQNGVNIALAATVARGLSPFLLPLDNATSSSIENKLSSVANNKSIRTVALALIGITMFDAISVFGTVANAAVVDAGAATEASNLSVMEVVARSKLASPTSELWQPGLLEIILGHDNSKVTEALGLGDVVFPSILVAWGFAADNVNKNKEENHDTSSPSDTKSLGGGNHYATASILGYAFGSFATEIVGSFSLLGNVGGLPALVFLVPSMLCGVTAMAWSRNELGEVWGGRGSIAVDAGGDGDGMED